MKSEKFIKEKAEGMLESVKELSNDVQQHIKDEDYAQASEAATALLVGLVALTTAHNILANY